MVGLVFSFFLSSLSCPFVFGFWGQIAIDIHLPALQRRERNSPIAFSIFLFEIEELVLFLSIFDCLLLGLSVCLSLTHSHSFPHALCYITLPAYHFPLPHFHHPLYSFTLFTFTFTLIFTYLGHLRKAKKK
ncbi:hypothetical protein B9Z19DRAFT_648211 [Tuber borchii]|uniref:Uncharacterized protein n=1 Tax=Tuber borchii TaxID=42251 RepID=A0A2T7A876_TUBBO|nr:hypothetical protein B9Z19DRAFT_648211 [Tuber borchii]